MLLEARFAQAILLQKILLVHDLWSQTYRCLKYIMFSHSNFVTWIMLKIFRQIPLIFIAIISDIYKALHDFYSVVSVVLFNCVVYSYLTKYSSM